MMEVNDKVTILDAGSSYYKEVAIVKHISNGQYCVEMSDKNLSLMFEFDLEKVIL